jgi:hypothetical protein
MADEANEVVASENDTTEEVVNTEEVEETTAQVETEDQPQEDIELLKEQNKRLFERAKKAEAEAKELKAKVTPKPQPKVEPSEKQDGLTPLDAVLLAKSNVSEPEDIEEVITYAQYKKISIKDALADKTLQLILRDKADTRATSEATNTGPARRGTVKPTDEQILANAAAGKEVDPVALAEARWNLKKSN